VSSGWVTHVSVLHVGLCFAWSVVYIENGLQTESRQTAHQRKHRHRLYSDDGRTAPELLEAADQQLYKYKRTEDRRTIPAQDQLTQTKRASR
jgi:hypothetical protein